MSDINTIVKRKSINAGQDPDVSYTFQFAENIITECGPRLAGSSASHKAAQMITSELNKYCDHAHMEQFSFHPNAFMGFTKVMVVSYLMGVFLMVLGEGFLIGAILAFLIGTLVPFSQFIFYRKFFDIFYNEAIGYNVIGVIEPEKEVHQQIIISGHHDSAHIFSFLSEHNQKFYSFKIFMGMIAYFLSFIFAIYLFIEWLIPHNLHPSIRFMFFGFSIVGLIFIIPYYYFIKKEGTIGAGDNLIASAMIVDLSRQIRNQKKINPYFLQNTRIILASFDAEEAGLRGSAAFVKQHEKELKEVPTLNLNIDSIYQLKDLQFVTRDINGIVELSSNLAKEGQLIALNLGYSINLSTIPFGGGATDAAEFARANIPAISLIGISTDYIREEIVYHTPKDTLENISPSAVLACLEILYHFVVNQEKKLSSDTGKS